MSHTAGKSYGRRKPADLEAHHLTIDVVKGRGAGFSLEAPEGVRFMIRSRLFTDDEHQVLEESL